MSATLGEITKDQLWEAAQEDPELIRQLMLNRQAKQALGTALSALPSQASPETAQRAQATENAWRDIGREFGLLSSTEIARAVGKSGRSYAFDRRHAGQLMAVKRGGHYFFPAFQLDASGPRPVIKMLVAEAKRLDVREASVLLWLVTPAIWWDGVGSAEANRPVDHLDDSDGVLAAFCSTFGADG